MESGKGNDKMEGKKWNSMWKIGRRKFKQKQEGEGKKGKLKAKIQR